MVKSAVKIRVSFDLESERILDSQSAIINWTRNHLLEKANALLIAFKQTQDKDICQTLYTKRGLRNLLPDLKKEKPFTKSVHSSPLKNSALELSASIQAYQKSRKGKRKGKQTGWPRFSSQKNKWSSLYYDEPNKGFKVNHRVLSLSLGQNKEGKRLKVEGRLEISPLKITRNERVLNFRLKKEYGEFYAIFTVEKTVPLTKPIKKIVALDPNHKNLAYGVGTDKKAMEISNPWFLRPLERQIDELKSRRDRCLKKSVVLESHSKSQKQHWRPSRRWSYYQAKLEKLYRKRRDQTKAFLYTIANQLFKAYDLVSIGNYTPRGGGLNRGMRRVMNNESLIGRFKEVLEWVALKSGKSFHIWNEYGSTKTCCACKHELDGSLNPAIRSWICPRCEVFHLRDENAAQNGLIRTLQMLCSSRLDSASPVQVESRRTWKFSGLGVDSISGVIGSISE